MPIYEFKCLKCGEFIELLIMNKDEAIEMKCPQCGGGDLERVLSFTSYTMGSPAAGNKASAQTRTCSGGSCTTYNIPGHGD
jgi:putative FmdB family regulatory protein